MFPKIEGKPPKWMVKIMENPYFLMDYLGGGENTPIFGEKHPEQKSQVHGLAPLGSMEEFPAPPKSQHIPPNGDESHEVPYWTPKPLKNEGFSDPQIWVSHNP